MDTILGLEKLIEGFRLSCQTEGKSPKTIEWYMSFLERFFYFLKTSNYPASIDEINRGHIRAFIQYLQVEARTRWGDKPLSQATIQGYVRTLKAFYAWITREGYLASNTMAQIPVPKAETKIINTLSKEQVMKLVQMCQITNGNATRDLAILLLMLDSGIRVSELVYIELNDVNITEGHIKIRRGKGSKERLVPIGSVVQKALWKYMNCGRPKPLMPKVTALFLNDIGMPLTKSGVQQMVRRCGKRAGIGGVRCSPHTFRHTFAKNYLLNGGAKSTAVCVLSRQRGSKSWRKRMPG